MPTVRTLFVCLIALPLCFAQKKYQNQGEYDI